MLKFQTMTSKKLALILDLPSAPLYTD